MQEEKITCFTPESKCTTPDPNGDRVWGFWIPMPRLLQGKAATGYAWCGDWSTKEEAEFRADHLQLQMQAGTDALESMVAKGEVQAVGIQLPRRCDDLAE